MKEMFWSEKKMRRIMLADKGFRRYWDEKFGMDFLGWSGTMRTYNSGLDPYYFYDPTDLERGPLKLVK